MRRFNITVNGKVYDVAVEEVAAGAAPVAAPVAAPAPAAAPAAAPAPAAEPAPAAAPAGPVEGTEVTAPMPGTIMEVNCAVGDTVTRGQAIFVLEAMKMNNDIVAPCDGKIVSVVANKGDAVNSSDVLAVIG